MGILQHIEHQISALNDLVKINNDRITGYEKASEGTADEDLKKLFTGFIEDSKRFNAELREHLQVLGGESTDGTSLAGKLHHTWIDVRSKFTGRDRLSILSDCEYGEDVANAAYRNALDDKELIWKDDKVVSILSHHLKEIKAAHDHIKELRDAEIALTTQNKKTAKITD
jgi:uncharacterized protein (TIGR02284 family)